MPVLAKHSSIFIWKGNGVSVRLLNLVKKMQIACLFRVLWSSSLQNKKTWISWTETAIAGVVIMVM